MRCHRLPLSTDDAEFVRPRSQHLRDLNTGAVAWSPDDVRVSGVHSPEVHGTLNGVAVKALPDSGSTVDAVSETFARRHGLKIDTADTKSITLMGGHVAESVGRVVGHFKFKGEKGAYRREFHVLRKSLHDVILGRSFLDETETLTKHDYRIVHAVRPCIQKGRRLFLMDETPEERIRCAVNGAAASAFPDTGSDLMLISGDFARRNSLKVHRGREYRTQIELIDGSTILTDGMVLDAELQFDIPPSSHELDFNQYHNYLSGLSSLMSKGGKTTKTTFICDLHVVENLPCDLILSNDFIFQNKVFSQFKTLFYSVPLSCCSGDTESLEQRLMFVRNKSGRSSWLSRWRRPTQNEPSTSKQRPSNFCRLT